MNQYDTPRNYGIPNPLGPRLHNWKGGKYNEGSLFHGPVYTRPAYTLPRIQRPVFGVEKEEEENTALEVVKLAAVSALLFFVINTTFDALEGKR